MDQRFQTHLVVVDDSEKEASNSSSGLEKVAQSSGEEIQGRDKLCTVLKELKSSLSSDEQSFKPDSFVDNIENKTYTTVFTSQDSSSRNVHSKPIDASLRLDSASSYESCQHINEETSLLRSSSETSYESAPPPAPDDPPPESSDSSLRSRSPSCSSTSSATPSLAQSQVDSSSEDRPSRPKASRGTQPIVFSISTYKHRDKEISYQKRITNTGSYQTQSKPEFFDSSVSQIHRTAKQMPTNSSYSLPRSHSSTHFNVCPTTTSHSASSTLDRSEHGLYSAKGAYTVPSHPVKSSPPTVARGLSFNDRKAVFAANENEWRADSFKKQKRFPVIIYFVLFQSSSLSFFTAKLVEIILSVDKCFPKAFLVLHCLHCEKEY